MFWSSIKSLRRGISLTKIKERPSTQDLLIIPPDTICKICYEDCSEEPLIETPCNCLGSLRFIHHNCLKKVQENSQNPKICSVCKSEYRERLIKQEEPQKRRYSILGLLLSNMKRIIAFLSAESAMTFSYFPKTTLLVWTGIFGTLSSYYIYHRYHNVHIRLRREYGRWSILYMRQGQPVQELKSGLLIRSIGLDEEPFKDATVLLMHYGADSGSYGVILNKIIQGFHIGGPVHLDSIMHFHNLEGAVGAKKIIDGVYVGGQIFEYIQENGYHAGDRLYVIRGLSGWAARQLDGEFRENMWQIVGEANAQRVWLELGAR